MEKLLVMKFGGTSLKDRECRDAAVNHIISAPATPVVVVSAMGRNGAPYATDSLRQLLISEGGEISDRDMDFIMCCGEMISAAVLAQAIKARGRRAKPLTGAQAGISTDGVYGSATVTGVDVEPIRKLLADGIIPVVTGFQGDFAGEFTTLGRGGSDTTAAVLGQALGADEVQIFTDVVGILTTDPVLYGEASFVPFATYQEVLEMAELGAKVIHPKAVEILESAGIPIRILSTLEKGPGTYVSAPVDPSPLKKKKVVTSVAVAYPRSLVSIKDNQADVVFKTVAEANVSVDLINVSPMSISFTIDSDREQTVRKVLPNAVIEPGFAKVSVVGAGMRGVPGVMAQVVEALAKHDIEIIRTADSHTSISCLVKTEELEDAVRALHEAFLLK